MYCVKFPSSTNLSLHTACSNSSFVTGRLGFRTRKRRTSNAFGERGTGAPERERVRRRESTTNGPKRYMPVRSPDVKVILDPPQRGWISCGALPLRRRIATLQTKLAPGVALNYRGPFALRRSGPTPVNRVGEYPRRCRTGPADTAWPHRTNMLAHRSYRGVRRPRRSKAASAATELPTVWDSIDWISLGVN